VFATLARHDDVATSRPDAGGSPRDEVDITAIAREALELPGQGETISLRNSSSPAHVSASEIRVVGAGRVPREIGQSIDTLPWNGHCRVQLAEL
jgi:hypothetical protein